MARTSSVLITGASRGLGHELNKRYLEQGWLTFPLVRQESVASALREGCAGQCCPIVADVTTDECVAKIATVVANHSDSLDVLINNAGINARARSIDDVTPQEVLDLLQVHCLGVIRCTKATLPLLRNAPRGKIINITSRLGSMSKNASGQFARLSPSYSYRIAKVAQNMFTLCLGHELMKEGIAVCAVHPGRLLTELAAPDADTPADLAAQRLVSWIEQMDESVLDHCVDLGNGEVPW